MMLLRSPPRMILVVSTPASMADRLRERIVWRPITTCDAVTTGTKHACSSARGARRGLISQAKQSMKANQDQRGKHGSLTYCQGRTFSAKMAADFRSSKTLYSNHIV